MWLRDFARYIGSFIAFSALDAIFSAGEDRSIRSTILAAMIAIIWAIRDGKRNGGKE